MDGMLCDYGILDCLLPLLTTCEIYRLSCTTNTRFSFGNELTPRWLRYVEQQEKRIRRRRRWSRMLRIAQMQEYSDYEVVVMLGPRRPIHRY